MVDVSGKPATPRRAIAQATVKLGAAACAAVRENAVAKGDVLGVARLAGIAAAKDTARLVPLAHPLPLTFIGVEAELVPRTSSLVITCEVATTGPTGVEMEALVGASVAALAVYDMVKAINKGVTIEKIALVEKTGGKSGPYRAPSLRRGRRRAE